jgi:hypothetical protein
MESLTLSTALVNQIMGYLGTRPYQEVFQLIAAVQDAAKTQADLANLQQEGGSSHARN